MLSLDEEREDGTAARNEVADWRPNPEQLYSVAELRQILQRALASLPYGLRVVFLLRDVEGLSMTETAEALGLSISNVKARLFRAHLKLRERLSPHFAANRRLARSAIPLKQLTHSLRSEVAAI